MRHVDNGQLPTLLYLHTLHYFTVAVSLRALVRTAIRSQFHLQYFFSSLDSPSVRSLSLSLSLSLFYSFAQIHGYGSRSEEAKGKATGKERKDYANLDSKDC